MAAGGTNLVIDIYILNSNNVIFLFIYILYNIRYMQN